MVVRTNHLPQLVELVQLIKGLLEGIVKVVLRQVVVVVLQVQVLIVIILHLF